MTAFECMFRLSVDLSCESWLLRFPICRDWGRRKQQLFNLILQRSYLSFLGTNFSFEHSNVFIFFVLTGKQFLLVFFQKLNFFKEYSQYSLILIVLNLFLILLDPILIFFEYIFYLIHMLFVRVDKFCLLSFQHQVHLSLEIGSEVIQIFNKLIYFFDMVLTRCNFTLYSKAFISGMFRLISVPSIFQKFYCLYHTIYQSIIFL